MVVFFLQIRRLLPPLRELVDTAMLDDPRERLLNGANGASRRLLAAVGESI